MKELFSFEEKSRNCIILKQKIIFIKYLLYLFNYEDKTKQIEIFNINQFFNTTIKPNSILIFEIYTFHYECTPGYTKYFLDLGFNVDIIMTNKGKGIFTFFGKYDNLRLYILDDTKYYESDDYIEKFRIIFNRYLAILVQTTKPELKYFYKKSNLLDCKNSIFVSHYYPEIRPLNFNNKIRTWTLLNFTNTALNVNPHYFGNIKMRDKNKVIRFFVVSSVGRNYDNLITASDKLNNEKFQFQIIVTGRRRTLTYSKIPNNIKKLFFFFHSLSYVDLFKIVDTVDYIIFTLKCDNPGDIEYINKKATGSAQLAYGFLKPCLINNYFADTYGMDNDNSFIFNDSLYFAMREAIEISNKEYRRKQYNMKKLSDKIYEISKNNVKTTIDYIIQNKNYNVIIKDLYF